jgi:hypothetical protein
MVGSIRDINEMQPTLFSQIYSEPMEGDTMISRTPPTRSVGPVTRLSACFAGLAAIAVGTLGFTSVASAAAPPVLKPPAGAQTLAAGSSTYLAGYQATPTGGLASASVTFTVPKISCTTADKTKSAVEWNGVYTDSLDAYAFVAGYCTSSGAAYDWVFQTLAGSFDKPGAAAGDVVVASLFQSGSSTWAEIHDLTANVFWFADNPVNQGDTVVDIGTFNESPSRPVPTFTTANFTNATVNGDYLGFESPTEFNALNGGDLLIKSGKLHTTATGSAFTEAFKKAS